MRICAICGSPHRGNTYSALAAMQEDHPEIDLKVIMLNEIDLQDCKGCYACVLLGAERCPLKDDRDMLLDEIEAADGIIFASCVHVNNITALMKKFITRLGYEGHRPRFVGKHGMVMSVCGMFGAKEANEYMKGMFSQFGFNIVTSLELQVATESEKEKAYNRERSKKAFGELIEAIESKRVKEPSMGELIRFHIFKKVSEYKSERFVADHEYYKDKDRIVSNAKVGMVKGKVAELMAMKTLSDFMANR